jgi:MtN3 and saliva related transmembrane protein
MGGFDPPIHPTSKSLVHPQTRMRWMGGSSPPMTGRFEKTRVFVTTIGLAAAFCTTVAFLPQVIRTWRTRSTGDLSLGMFLVFTTGIFLWLVYGLYVQDVPLIAANSVTFVLSGTILFFKLRHG